MSTRRFVSSDDAVYITPLAHTICIAFDRILIHPKMPPEGSGDWPFRRNIRIQKQLFQYWVDKYGTVPAGVVLPRPAKPVLPTIFNDNFWGETAPVCLEDILEAAEDFRANMDAYGLKERSPQRKCIVKAEFISLLIKDMFKGGVVVSGDR